MNKRVAVTGRQRYFGTLISGGICLLICCWMLAEGSNKLLLHDSFDAFYDGQAASLLQGRWDVAPEAIQGEAFLYRGKYYGYFGFVPALPRMVLNRLFPAASGHWTRLLMMLGVAFSIAAIVAFLAELGGRSDPFLMAVMVLGSTLLFLCSHAIVYNEAILTGSTLALWAYYFFCRYLREPRLIFLSIAGLLSFLSFFSRAPLGSGPPLLAAFLCVMLLAGRPKLLRWLQIPAPPRPKVHAAVLALSVGLTAIAFVAINHAKFDTWFNPVPWKYQVQVQADPARLARTGGQLNHLGNVPFLVRAYFGPDRIDFSPSFPWVGLTQKHPRPGTLARLDMLDRYSSVPAAMPALALLSVTGILYATRKRRWMLPVLAASLIAGCSVLVMGSVSYRYLHDFYPFLVLASVLGASAVQSIPDRSLRTLFRAAIVVAGIWSIAVNLAFTLQWQREGFWPKPETNASFLRWRSRADSLLPFGKLAPILYHIGDDVESPKPGQLLTAMDPAASYRYDGRQWQYVAGEPYHRFRLLAKFAPASAGSRMALWFAGTAGAGENLSIVYATPTRLRFCSDQGGKGGVCGPEVEFLADREYRLLIDANRLNSLLSVALDGQNVLQSPTEFHRWKNEDAQFGKSLDPAAHGMDFTGSIQMEPVNY